MSKSPNIGNVRGGSNSHYQGKTAKLANNSGGSGAAVIMSSNIMMAANGGLNSRHVSA